MVNGIQRYMGRSWKKVETSLNSLIGFLLIGFLTHKMLFVLGTWWYEDCPGHCQMHLVPSCTGDPMWVSGKQYLDNAAG